MTRNCTWPLEAEGSFEPKKEREAGALSPTYLGSEICQLPECPWKQVLPHSSLQMRKQPGQHLDGSLVGPREEELFKLCLDCQPTETEIINICCSKPLTQWSSVTQQGKTNVSDNPTVSHNQAAGLFLFLLILSRTSPKLTKQDKGHVSNCLVGFFFLIF